MAGFMESGSSSRRVPNVGGTHTQLSVSSVQSGCMSSNACSSSCSVSLAAADVLSQDEREAWVWLDSVRADDILNSTHSTGSPFVLFRLLYDCVTQD